MTLWREIWGIVAVYLAVVLKGNAEGMSGVVFMKVDVCTMQ